jgi:glyoxylase I family protein
MLIRKVHLAADTATPEMMRKLDEVKREMLDEWSRSKHAAWMHEGSQR